MKTPLWLYISPFRPQLCCWWAIKILPNQPIKNTNSVCWSTSIPTNIPLGCPIQKLHSIYIPLYLFCLLVKCYNYLPPWKIEKGDIIWCGAPKSQIWIKPWKSMDGNFHTSGNNWISLNHAYTWYLPRGKPILNSTQSSSLKSPHQYHSLSHIQISTKAP